MAQIAEFEQDHVVAVVERLARASGSPEGCGPIVVDPAEPMLSQCDWQYPEDAAQPVPFPARPRDESLRTAMLPVAQSGVVTPISLS